jgi:hypothetical protein
MRGRPEVSGDTDADRTFQSKIGMSGPTGRTAQSYFFR